MTPEEKQRFEIRATVAKAMGHPTRLFIIDQLAGGERCVCQLTDMIKADVSTVSRHLSVLRNAGIIRDEKRGKQVFYTLACTCVLDFFSCMETVIRAQSGQPAEECCGIEGER